MRVAVTGASGFVGGRVAARLAAGGHEVIGFGRRPATPPGGVSYRRWDLLDGPLPDAPSIDAVVHAAAAVDDWGPRERFEHTNVAGTGAVLDTFPSARLVHVSSASVYDHSRDVRHASEAWPREAGHPNAYAATKAAAERLVEARRPDATILRPHAVWGAGDPTLLPRLLAARRLGVLLAVGDGRNCISVTHVDNLAEAVALAVEGPASGPFNVTDGVDAPVDDLLRTLLRRLGLRPRVAYLPRRPALALAALLERTSASVPRLPPPRLTRYAVLHLAREWTLDIRRAREELGYRPVHDLETGPLVVG
jgi:2-alkyl-3-oxoalkanoate reductase